jgi:hypothetical protein
MEEADAFMRSKIDEHLIRSIVSLIPRGWLNDSELPEVYATFLLNRLHIAATFVTEINHARQKHI